MTSPIDEPLGAEVEAELRRAQLVDLDRQLGDLIARRTSLARQIPGIAVGASGRRRPDHARELQTVFRFYRQFGEEGRVLGLLLVRLARGGAVLNFATSGLAARVCGRIAIVDDQEPPA